MQHITLILGFPCLGVFLGRNGDAFGDEVLRLHRKGNRVKVSIDNS